MNRSLNCASTSKNKWCQTNYEKRHGSLIWKIRGFSLCSLSNTKWLSSSRFGITGESENWGLKLYPNGLDEESRDFISVLLVSRIEEHSSDDESDDLSEDNKTTCSISVIDAHGEKVHAIEYIYEEQTPDTKYIARKDLLGSNTLLPDDQLTISCVITITNRTEDAVQRDALRRVDDIERPHAAAPQEPVGGQVQHLRGHVPQSDEMIESATNTVIISDVDTDVMEELLRFVYTDSCSYPSVDFALKVLSSADKYDISALKIHCADYLRSNMSADSVIQVLVAADVHGVASLRQECMDLICSELSYLVTVVPNWKSQFNSCPNLLCEILERLESRCSQ